MQHSDSAVAFLLKIKGDIENHLNRVEIVRKFMTPVESALAHCIGELKKKNSIYTPCSNERCIILSSVFDADGWKDVIKSLEETELEDDTPGG